MFDAMEMDLIIQKVVRMNEKFHRNIDASCILFHNEMIKRLVLTQVIFLSENLFTLCHLA